MPFFSVLRCLRSSGVLLCCLLLSHFFSLFSSLLFPFFSVLLSFSWKLALRRTKTTGAEASALSQRLLLLGKRKRWPRWLWSLFVFSPSTDAFSRDDDEGVLCWWSCCPCLCVFLTFDSVVLMAFSALPLSRFFLSFFSHFSLFSPFFFCLLFPFFSFHSNEQKLLFSAFYLHVFGFFFCSFLSVFLFFLCSFFFCPP